MIRMTLWSYTTLTDATRANLDVSVPGPLPSTTSTSGAQKVVGCSKVTSSEALIATPAAVTGDAPTNMSVATKAATPMSFVLRIFLTPIGEAALS